MQKASISRAWCILALMSLLTAAAVAVAGEPPEGFTHAL